jgi:hypothetical protein
LALNNNKIESYLKKYIVSFISWDIVAFFAHNRGVYDTAEGIARRLGRKTEEVEKELDYLAKISFLNRKQTESGIVYSLAPVPENEKFLEEFVARMENRIFRLNLISQVLKKRAGAGENSNL